jgi:hypothetical protein
MPTKTSFFIALGALLAFSIQHSVRDSADEIRRTALQGAAPILDIQQSSHSNHDTARNAPYVHLNLADTGRENRATANNTYNSTLAVSHFGRDYTDSVCLTEESFQEHGQRLARSFSYHPKESWCIPTNKRGKHSRDKGPGKKWQGLLLVKTPKAASSTAAGVVLRIHSRHGCAVQWNHVPGQYYFGRGTRRMEKSSFLIATVRNPSSRALSHAWYGAFDKKTRLNPTDKNVIQVVQGKKNNGGMYNMIETI